MDIIHTDNIQWQSRVQSDYEINQEGGRYGLFITHYTLCPSQGYGKSEEFTFVVGYHYTCYPTR